MTDGLSEEDFDAVVRAVSGVVSGFCPGSGLRTVERTYRAWKTGEPALICEIEVDPGARLAWRGVVPESAGWGKARRYALEDMSSRGGWPSAGSGEEMSLLLSLRPEGELRELSRRCAVPGPPAPNTAPAEV